MKMPSTPHEVDNIGYPLDPVLRGLQFRLGDLASMWRGAWAEPKRREELVHEYQVIMEELYSRGWDDELDMDSLLPDELMPEQYLRLHSPPPGDSWDDPDWDDSMYDKNPQSSEAAS